MWVGHDGKSDGDTHAGVTAVLPVGKTKEDGIDSNVMAAFFSLNGNGEMMGTHLIEETEFLEVSILLTNTASVGCGRTWVVEYAVANQGTEDDPDEFSLIVPVVVEIYDGWLNNILSFNTTQEMVENATKSASSSNTDEGNVGAETGTICYNWNGGIGTAFRQVVVYQSDNKTTIKNPKHQHGDHSLKVGVLVQANQGTYWDLVIRGVPTGQDKDFAPPPDSPDNRPRTGLSKPKPRKSSIILVIATGAPLLPHKLKRLVRRATQGLTTRWGKIGTAGRSKGTKFANAEAAEVEAGKSVNRKLEEGITRRPGRSPRPAGRSIQRWRPLCSLLEADR